MNEAYYEASKYLDHPINIPTTSSKRVTSAGTNTIDINQQVKYLEDIAIKIYNQIEVKSIKNNNNHNDTILLNELEEKPKSKYILSSKKQLLKLSGGISNELTLIERPPWRCTVQTSNKNEKIFHNTPE